MSTTTKRQYMTTTEAGRELGVTGRRVRQLIDAGILPAIQMPNGAAIRREDLALARSRRTTLGRPKNASKSE